MTPKTVCNYLSRKDLRKMKECHVASCVWRSLFQNVVLVKVVMTQTWMAAKWYTGTSPKLELNWARRSPVIAFLSLSLPLWMNADGFQLQNDNIMNSDTNYIDLFGYVSCLVQKLALIHCFPIKTSLCTNFHLIHQRSVNVSLVFYLWCNLNL